MTSEDSSQEEATENVLRLLSSDDYQIYNRSTARALKSVNAAIMLSEIINRYLYHKERDELRKFENHDGEWVLYTVEKCEERTCLSYKEQTSAIKILQKHGFIKKKSIGLPAKRHFQVNEEIKFR